MVVSDVACR